MRTTVNWMRRHKFGMLGLCVAMTAIMIMPEDADAGWRRRARRCWRQGGHWAQPYAYSNGYSNFGYSNQGYSNYGYRGGNFGYAHDGTGYGVRGSYQSGTRYDGSWGVQGDTRTQMGADIDARGSYDAARPDLNETRDDLTPPPPVGQEFRSNQRTDIDARGRTDIDARGRTDIDAQGRIEGQNRGGAEADLNNQTDVQGNVRQNQSDAQIRQRSGAEAESEAAEGEPEAEAELNNETDADANIESDSLPPAPTDVEASSSTDAEAEVDSQN